jgi:hypothetical protein
VANKFESSAPLQYYSWRIRILSLALDSGAGKAGPLAVVRWAKIAVESKRKGNGGIDALSEETKIGKRVRVSEDNRTANWRGQEGTIAKRWGTLPTALST